MRIYTLVSLLLGIVGATYAASNSLRTQFDERLNRAHQESKGVDFGKHTINAQTLPKVQKAKKWVNIWYFVWICSHIIPAMLLNIFVFLIIGSAAVQWQTAVATDSQDLSGYPWCLSHAIVWAGLGLGFGCVCLALWARKKTISNSKTLDDLVVASAPSEQPKLTDPTL